MEIEDDEIAGRDGVWKEEWTRQLVDRIAGRAENAESETRPRFDHRMVFRIQRKHRGTIIGGGTWEGQFVETAVYAVIDVQFVSLTQHHLRHERNALGAQRQAGSQRSDSWAAFGRAVSASQIAAK